MQEQMNTAMTSLSASVGQDVPTLDEVRDKIEARYARALGASELGSQSVEGRMLEVEQAQINSEAQNRLDQIRQFPVPPVREPIRWGRTSSCHPVRFRKLKFRKGLLFQTRSISSIPARIKIRSYQNQKTKRQTRKKRQ